jgi:hypothetical protein
MAIEGSRASSRRNVLVGGLGGLAGLLAGRLANPQPAAATDGDNAILGATNTSESVTRFESSVDGVSLMGSHSLVGVGVQGSSLNYYGVLGDSLDHTGVRARSGSEATSTGADFSYKTGVFATAGNDGDAATNTDETGVYGYCDTSSTYSAGVWGDSNQGVGVVGTGDWGVFASGNVGLRADGPIALYTTGRLVFSGRSGHKAVTSGHYYVDVAVAGMASSADVIATLRTRRTGYYIAAVASYAGKFRLYLNKTATSTIYFNYLVLN